MSVIPFGVVGTIFGHYMWDVPMSMFTVVGLLGMTGIIINDSIVLITSIDEQAKTKSLLAAIIEGTTSRLRPVLLTTLTTVLGLLPLLYERSSQAAFLLPTVITLVYGLAFGMVLVLMIVPALLAVQNDFKVISVAFKYGLRFRTKRVSQTLWVAMAFLALWFSQTFGWVFFTGHIAPWVGLLAAERAGASQIGLAAALFIVGALLLLGGLYVVSFIWLRLRQQRA